MQDSPANPSLTPMVESMDKPAGLPARDFDEVLTQLGPGPSPLQALRGAIADLPDSPQKAAVVQTLAETEVRLRETIAQPVAIAVSAGEPTSEAAETQPREVSLLRKTESLANVGSFEWITEGTRVWWSDEMIRIFGHDPATFRPRFQIGMQQVHPLDRPRVQRELEYAIDHVSSFETASRIIRPSGEIRYLLSRLTITRNSEGRATMITGVCMDITQRKLNEDTIRHLLELASPTIGDTFFQNLANHLCRICRISKAIISEFDVHDPRLARTIAVSRHGKTAKNITHEIGGSPLMTMLTRPTEDCYVHASRVRHAYPDDRLLADEQAEGYLGILLHDSHGRPSGSITLLHTRPLAEVDRAQSILTVAAGRAASELERRRSHIELVDNRQLLLQAVGALEQSVKELETLADTSPMAIFRARGDGSGEFVNADRYRALSGRRLESWTDNSWLSSIHYGDRQRVRESWQRAMKRRSGWRDEFRYIHLDGSTTWVLGEAKPCQTDDPESLIYVGALVDITTLKEAEGNLQRTQFMVDHAAIGLLWIHSDSRIAYANQCASRLLGYSRVELTEMSFLKIIDHSLESWREWCDDVAQHGQLEFETDLKRRDGSILLANLTAIAKTFAGENYLVVDIQDISRRKKVEERLEMQSAELVHVSRLTSMGQMMAALSHELAQPLNALTNFAEIGRMQLQTRPEEESLASLFTRISRQSERASEILHRIRSYVRQTESNRSTHDINELVIDSLSLMQHELKRHHILVDVQVAVGTISAVVDRVRIQQVIVNLLTNARDAVAGVEAERKCVFVRTAFDETSCYIQVEDHGCGISPEIAERMFDEFVTSKDEGMGIGLSICRTIVTEHGGTLTHEPGDPFGTRFILTLPLSTDEESAPAERLRLSAGD